MEVLRLVQKWRSLTRAQDHEHMYHHYDTYTMYILCKGCRRDRIWIHTYSGMDDHDHMY